MCFLHVYSLSLSLYGAATTLTSGSCYFLSIISLSLTLHNPLLFLAVNDPKEYLRWSICLDRALLLNVSVQFARRLLNVSVQFARRLLNVSVQFTRRRPRRHPHHLAGRK